ncbi:SUN domain-containing ossification factor [Tribolium madens]|uniref:SUN domain-containing ossification factor n=1 Tax=Tribolium madens TaxID=41895 RepID=UPI001CF744CB|nr:SUN domain-containing ossification factor [Tribolium madens]
MKTSFLCVEYVFILALCSKCLVCEDAATTPSPNAPIGENISSDSIQDTKKTLESEKSDDVIRGLEPSADVVSNFNEKTEGETLQVFAEATSQNSGVANDITTSGQPVVVTLSDVATAELQQRAILPSQDPPPEPQSANHTFKLNQSRSDKIDVPSVKENLTEEIPSFSEWAQKQLQEAEKNKSNTSTHHSNGKQASGAKFRWKNYASLDCGAKVVASNPEAVSPSAILSPSRDEYKLNTCTSRIWFIVELCEAIQAKKIDLANFELFSSSPKDFAVFVSDRFPTREWSNVGHFTAKDERDVQSFDLHPHLFGKYIKVEVKSHYGSEHYCPISLFRVYGTSEFEVLQKEDQAHEDRPDDDDDDDESLDLENGDSRKNLFSSATDAVISMVKKAAEVLGNKGNYSNQTEISNNTKQAVPLIRVCTSPSHLVVCDNCSDDLFGHIYELLSCHDSQIWSLIKLTFIRNVLIESNLCQKFGFEFCKVSDKFDVHAKYIKALFPEHFLGAMCNMAAVYQNKVVLNVSNHSNDTIIDDDKMINIETSEPHILPVETRKEPEVTDALSLQSSEAASTPALPDVTLTSQIKPTKTLNSEFDSRQSNTEASSDKSEVKSVVTSTEPVQSNLTEPEVEPEVENVTESVELDDPLDAATPQAQKESVFLRLSNRIKALERNMSLSGQYLEELSKRYKKQVEEIQKLLDKTILSLNEESKKKDERNKQLEERLNVLTANLEALLAERRSWSSTISCVVISSLVTLFIVTFCCKIPEPVVARRPELKRRKSVDVVQHSAPKKKRRPSDQALKIVRSSMEASDNFRKKKKKKNVLRRSNSISTLGEEKKVWQEAGPVDWVEGKRLEEVPFVLEESEHSTLEPIALEEKITPPSYIQTAMNARTVRANGEAKREENGGVNVEGTPKKEKKGLRRIFKKVF